MRMILKRRIKRCHSIKKCQRYYNTNQIINFNANEIEEFNRNGYICKENIIPNDIVDKLRERVPKLFKGEFNTGIYPDEWYGREGISLPDVTKEICNAWKSDTLVSSVVLSSRIGRLCAQLGEWKASRIGQDDVWWKPSSGKEIAFHQDSDYVSCQFVPYTNSSITAWLALEDVSKENGSLEYAVGSHRWKRNLHTANEFHAPNNHYKSQLKHAAKANNIKNIELHCITLKKGGIAFHHQDIWHGSGKNTTMNRSRKAIGIHMLNADVKFKSDNVGYIYGRYKRINDNSLDENFFPITYVVDNDRNKKRSEWLENYCEFDLL